jgi:isopropylmalate/homocitrate/citramalate synthase
MATVKWVECPRDAWQGFSRFIPTEEKVAFLKNLLEAGFRHLDLTSFVSPRWVPQMADAKEVLKSLPPPEGRTYLAIVANERGLERALKAPNLTHVGYPFSLSETFQRKNTNRSPEESWPLVKATVEGTRGGSAWWSTSPWPSATRTAIPGAWRRSWRPWPACGSWEWRRSPWPTPTGWPRPQPSGRCCRRR